MVLALKQMSLIENLENSGGSNGCNALSSGLCTFHTFHSSFYGVTESARSLPENSWTFPRHPTTIVKRCYGYKKFMERLLKS